MPPPRKHPPHSRAGKARPAAERASAPNKPAVEQPIDAAAALSQAARLEQQGDLHGAPLAYRQADEAGDAAGATHLGVLLERRGDAREALDAHRRASERGDEELAERAGAALAGLPQP